MANDKITPVGIYSQHGAFLTVTDLMELLKVSRFVVDRMLKMASSRPQSLAASTESAPMIF